MDQEISYEIKYTQLFINNEYVNSSKNETIEVINPATEEVIAKVQSASEVDVDIAVKAARAAFIKVNKFIFLFYFFLRRRLLKVYYFKQNWRDFNPVKRSALINKFADLLEKNLEELAYLECIDNGKPLMNAQDDITESIKCFRFFAGFCDKISGK